MLKKLKGYKTVIFNVAMPVISIMVVLGMLPTETAPSPEQVDAFLTDLTNVIVALASIWGAGNVALRKVTDGPMFNKAPSNQPQDPGLGSGGKALCMALLAALFIGLTGCASTPSPETPQEKFAFYETQREGVANQIGNMAEREQIPEDMKPAVVAALVAAREAFHVWRLNLGDFNSQTAALQSLRSLQSLLRELQKSIEEDQTEGPPAPTFGLTPSYA